MKHVDVTDYCWIWVGKTTGEYGRTFYNGKRMLAHRASYTIFNGGIPEGLVVRHKCDNPLCVNPEHLELGTQRDNVQDMYSRGRHGNTSQPGSNNAMSKVNEESVKDMRSRFLSGTSTTQELSVEFSISSANVTRILSGNTWRHVSFANGEREAILQKLYENKSKPGALNGSAKYTVKDISDAKVLDWSGFSISAISTLTGISETQVARIINEECWK
jgi:DNA invertase Pin-like site-specific DNA recombinase